METNIVIVLPMISVFLPESNNRNFHWVKILITYDTHQSVETRSTLRKQELFAFFHVDIPIGLAVDLVYLCISSKRYRRFSPCFIPLRRLLLRQPDERSQFFDEERIPAGFAFRIGLCVPVASSDGCLSYR